MWHELSLAFKATVKTVASGSFGDDGAHGSGSHIPFMYS